MPNLVYAGTGREVKTVLIAGQVLVENGEVLGVDETAVRADAQTHSLALAQRVANDPVHREMILLEAMAAGQL